MIGKVTGFLEYRAADHVLIDTGGVGYILACSERTLAALPPQGGVVSLYTELVVREDLLQLIGFSSLAEREGYRLLTSVQGVGSKAALAVLGALGVDGLSRALTLGDAAAFRAAPGIGPKIAQRLVLELRAKAATIMAMGAEGARSTLASVPGGAPVDVTPAHEPPRLVVAASSPAPVAVIVDAHAQADALSALVNLGYAPVEAAAAVAEAATARDLDGPGLIRAALRLLAPKG